jgi:phosphatidylglycerophosphatase A
VARLFASFFGTGLIPRKVRGADAGAGTVASLVAFGIGQLLPPLWGRLTALGVCILLGAWAIGQVATSDEDPGWVVIDEAAGTFLATIGLGLGPALIALAIFRLADIQKHWFPGVRAAERLSGGIIADDLVAGAYGLAAGWLIQAL